MKDLTEKQFKTTGIKTADVYLPCGYTWVEKELRDHTPSNGQIILAIDGCDKIVAKESLWRVLKMAFGRKQAAELTPNAFVTSDTDDMAELERSYDPNKIYIMKKNIQRQQGLKLTKSLQELQSAKDHGYTVIQEYLMNPLLFDNRKFDMRVYLLIIQQGPVQYYYRHTGGRCHYTSTNFTTADISDKIHIPTGYHEDQSFKDTHPETLRDLQEYLDAKFLPNTGRLFFKRMDRLLGKCCYAFSRVLGQDQRYKATNAVRCQLFGLDLLSDDHFRPTLIEINKGPEMAWNTEIERDYKAKLLTDMFSLLGYTNDTTDTNNGNRNEYIPIMSIEV